MNRPEDNFTTTVDAAEAFERYYGEGYDDGPDPADYADDPLDVRDTGDLPYDAADFDPPEAHGAGGGDPDDLPF